MEALPGKVRTLGIAWGPPARQSVKVALKSNSRSKLNARAEEEESRETETTRWIWRPSYLISAHSDSSLRKFNLATGRVVGRMSVGKLSARGTGGKSRKRHSVVWAVGCLM
jgi:U3 small nucleolar RNA-associated protein 4